MEGDYDECKADLKVDGMKWGGGLIRSTLVEFWHNPFQWNPTNQITRARVVQLTL
jgi:hypothetical protein